MSVVGRTAAVLGATGAVGTEVVRSLLDQGYSVVLINRRSVEAFDKPGVTQHVVPMDDSLESSCASIMAAAKVSSAFITMGVGAPSKTKGQAGADQLRAVDVTLPSACARGARRAGVEHVGILTAVGADASSTPDADDGFLGLLPMARAGGPLYNQCKGQVEVNIKELGFPTFSTFRPAALLGTPNTPQIVEVVGRAVDFLLPAKYKCSEIATLADAMVLDAGEKEGAGGAEFEGAEFAVFEGEPLHELYKRTAAKGGGGEL
jgi:nucleoside-diphosphate-sugar epimerase